MARNPFAQNYTKFRKPPAKALTGAQRLKAQGYRPKPFSQGSTRGTVFARGRGARGRTAGGSGSDH